MGIQDFVSISVGNASPSGAPTPSAATVSSPASSAAIGTPVAQGPTGALLAQGPPGPPGPAGPQGPAGPPGGGTSVSGTGVWHNVSGVLQPAALIGAANTALFTNATANDVLFAAFSGDVTPGATPGVLEVTGLLDKPLPSLPGSAQVLEYTGSAWAFVTAASIFTPGGDIAGNGTSTATTQYVSSISYSSAAAGGTVAINGTATAFQIAANNAGFSLSQAAQNTSANPANLTIKPQWQAGTDEGSAAANTPGSLIVSLGAPYTTTHAGSEALLVTQRNGVQMTAMGAYSSGYGGWWGMVGTPTTNNWAIISNGGSTQLNATSTLYFDINGSAQTQLVSGAFAPYAAGGTTLGTGTYYWSELFATNVDTGTASTTLGIGGANATQINVGNTSTTGGISLITKGSSFSVTGEAGGTFTFNIGNGSGDYLWLGAQGSSAAAQYLPTGVTFQKAVASPTIQQSAPTTDTATTGLTITGQPAYASAITNKNAGTVRLDTGAPVSGGSATLNLGTTSATVVAIGNTAVTTLSETVTSSGTMTGFVGATQVYGRGLSSGDFEYLGASGSEMRLVPTGITWQAGVAAPALQQSVQNSSTAPQNLTVQPQFQAGSDEGSAAANTPGSFIVNLGIPYTTTHAGSEAQVRFQRNGSNVFQFAAVGGATAGALYIGNQSNYALYQDSSSNLHVDAPGGLMYFELAGGAVAELTSSAFISYTNGALTLGTAANEWLALYSAPAYLLVSSGNPQMEFLDGGFSGASHGGGIGWTSANSVGQGMNIALVAQQAKSGSAAAGGQATIASGAGDGTGADGGVLFGFNLTQGGSITDKVQFIGANSSAGRGTLQWSSAITPNLSQASESTATQGANFTITPQQSTQATNQGGGSLVVALQAPLGTGTEAFLQTTRGGTQMTAMGAYSGSFGGWWGMVGTPTTGNWAIISNGTVTQFNASSTLYFDINGSAQWYTTAGNMVPYTDLTGVNLGGASNRWASLYVTQFQWLGLSGTANSQQTKVQTFQAVARTTSTSAVTAYTYTIPSATSGQDYVVFIDVKWVMRPPSGTGTQNGGWIAAAFECYYVSSLSTTAQLGSTTNICGPYVGSSSTLSFSLGGQNVSINCNPPSGGGTFDWELVITITLC